jgi:hypothetical protein
MLADAVPMALAHGLLAAEMGMNLQMALDDRGVQQQIAALAERHLEVHPHLGGEQPMGERHRHRIGQHIIAPYRHGLTHRRHGFSGSSLTVKSAAPEGAG